MKCVHGSCMSERGKGEAVRNEETRSCQGLEGAGWTPDNTHAGARLVGGFYRLRY